MTLRLVNAVLVSALLVTGPAWAQATDGTGTGDPPATSRSPNPLVAGVVEWVVPTVGYAYAGDWRKGLVPNTVRVGGLVLFATQVNSAARSSEEDRCPSACVAGFILAGVGTVWAVVGAASTASSRAHRNRDVGARISVTPTSVRGMSVGLRVPLQ